MERRTCALCSRQRHGGLSSGNSRALARRHANWEMDGMLLFSYAGCNSFNKHKHCDKFASPTLAQFPTNARDPDKVYMCVAAFIHQYINVCHGMVVSHRFYRCAAAHNLLTSHLHFLLRCSLVFLGEFRLVIIVVNERCKWHALLPSLSVLFIIVLTD